MPAWALPERKRGQWVLRPQAAVLARMPDGAIYFEQCYWPFWTKTTSNACPRPGREHVVRACQPAGPPRRRSRRPRVWPRRPRLRAQTDRAIIGLFGGNLLEIGQFLYRNDNFLMLLAGDPARAHEFLDRLVEIHLANLEQLPGGGRAVHRHDRVRRRPGNAERAANFAGHVPRVLQAAARPMWRRAKELADVKVMLHCCGGVRPADPRSDRGRAGRDNPVQITCTGMDAGRLKRDFGDRSRSGAAAATPASSSRTARRTEIRRHVRRAGAILRPAAASSSSRSTTSWPTFRRKTSWPCSTPPTGEHSSDARQPR